MAPETPMISPPEPNPKGVTVRLHGEIDYAKTPAFRQALLELVQADTSDLILDLADVGYMDSSGVATLIEVLQACRQAGRRLALCRLTPEVRSIFEIARLTSVFEVFASVEEARK